MLFTKATLHQLLLPDEGGLYTVPLKSLLKKGGSTTSYYS